MAKSLVDFLEDLDSNAKLKESYTKDAVATAQSYGLSDQDVKLIKEQDWDTVKKQFESSGHVIRIHTY